MDALAPVYSFSENKKLGLADKTFALLADTVTINQDSIYRYQLETGNNLVFQYLSCFNDYTGLSLRGEQRLFFQVPKGATLFALQDSAALFKAKALVAYNCGECFGGVRFLTNGYIKGTKLDETTWLIEAVLSSRRFPATVYSFNEKFKRE